MSLEKCNIYVIGIILSHLSPVDVLSFSRACPTHQMAVHDFWMKQNALNIDDVLVRDLGNLMQVTQNCLRVTEVRCRKKRPESYNNIVDSIVGNNPALTVLDIPGLILTEKDKWLEHCVHLKSLNITFDYHFDNDVLTRMLDGVCRNNLQLENLCVECASNSVSAFQNLPNTMKTIQITRHEKFIPIMMNNTVFDRITHFQLEKLCLPKEYLTVDHITRLHTQTRLKSLDIMLDEHFDNTQDLIILFRNNKGLEDVSIRGSLSLPLTVHCLHVLPLTIKRLRLEPLQLQEWPDLIHIIYTWKNLESLDLGYDLCVLRHRIQLLLVSQRLQHLTLDWGGRLSLVCSLKSLIHLKELCLKAIDQSNEERKDIGGFPCLEKLVLSEIVSIEGKYLSDWIVALPKLKEFVLSDEYYNCDSHTRFIHRISRCPNLTIARFHKCFRFRNKDALILIRNCHSLKELEIIGSDQVTENLVTRTEAELEKQKERTHILHLTLTFKTITPMFTEATHRLLNLHILRLTSGF